MADKKFYVVHTKRGYWVGTFIFSEQLRHAKIYTSLHYANETAKRLNHVNADQYDPKIREVSICLVDEQPAADVVEVVRCKDCGWSRMVNVNGKPEYYCQCWNPGNLIHVNAHGFYVWGERKEQT